MVKQKIRLNMCTVSIGLCGWKDENRENGNKKEIF